jgi:uncharacterized protein
MSASQPISINLARLLREGGTAEADGVISGEIDLGGETLELEGPAPWRVGVTSVSGEGGQEFWMSGEIAGKAVLECRRCLTPTATPVRAHFQNLLRYAPGVEGLEVLEQDDEEIFLFGHPNLDLEPFLTEAFAVELPITVLCKEDCKGLCPVCGANRNETNCGHLEKSGKLGNELDKLFDNL